MPTAVVAFAGVILLSSCCYGRIFPVLALAFVAVGVPWALVTFAVGRRTRARHMAISLVAIAVGAASGIALDHFKGAGLAMRNERLIIPAVDHFRADHGRHPDSLNELVPRYLPSTRPAGTPLSCYRIMYWRSGDDAILSVTVMVPFGRRTWAFKARRARYID
jgi:hypothetical protein